MSERKSATDEMIKRIKGLDREESLLMRDLTKQRAALAQLEAELVQIGNTRRQWEFALKQLGIETDATLDNKVVVKVEGPKDPIPVPVTQNVIGQVR